MAKLIKGRIREADIPPGMEVRRKVVPSTQLDITLTDYLSLPAGDGEGSNPRLLIAKECIGYGKTWEECHMELHGMGHFMLTPRQFVDFVNYLRSGSVYDGAFTKVPSIEAQSILMGITMTGKHPQAEWLDADFTFIGSGYRIRYNHRVIAKKLLPQTVEPLEECLTRRGSADIFESANRHGMPTRRLERGISYHPPDDESLSVARFVAGKHTVYLSCNSDPSSTHPYLGVRPAVVCE